MDGIELEDMKAAVEELRALLHRERHDNSIEVMQLQDKLKDAELRTRLAQRTLQDVDKAREQWETRANHLETEVADWQCRCDELGSLLDQVSRRSASVSVSPSPQKSPPQSESPRPSPRTPPGHSDIETHAIVESPKKTLEALLPEVVDKHVPADTPVKRSADEANHTEERQNGSSNEIAELAKMPANETMVEAASESAPCEYAGAPVQGEIQSEPGPQVGTIASSPRSLSITVVTDANDTRIEEGREEKDDSSFRSNSALAVEVQEAAAEVLVLADSPAQIEIKIEKEEGTEWIDGNCLDVPGYARLAANSYQNDSDSETGSEDGVRSEAYCDARS
jgi:hypothetical protein